MAGKEDAVKDLCAAGRGRAPPGKMVVEGEEFKAEEVAAFAPRPLPRTFGSKHQRVSDLTLRSCSGGHTPTEEEKAAWACAGGHPPAEKAAKADSVSVGVLRPCTVSHALSGEDSDAAAAFPLHEGGKTNGAADAGAVQVLEASAVEGQEESDPDDDVKMVEMPMAHIRYILSQKKENHVVPPIEDYDIYTEEAMRSTVFTKENIDVKRQAFRNLHASLQAKHDDFFQYQAWVGDEFEKNGRVMVPEPCTKEELQEQINDVWARCKEEYARDHPDDYSDTETEGEA